METKLDTNRYEKIWSITNGFRGEMPINDFRDVLVGLIFYRLISEDVEKLNKKYFEENKILENRIFEFEENLKLLQKSKLGYSIKYDRTYGKILKNICYNFSVLFEALYEISKQFEIHHGEIFEPLICNIMKINREYRSYRIVDLLMIIDNIINDMDLCQYRRH